MVFQDHALFLHLSVEANVTLGRRHLDRARRRERVQEVLDRVGLASGERLVAHVPSHHDHRLGEWIGIRAEVHHIVTFPRATGG